GILVSHDTPYTITLADATVWRQILVACFNLATIYEIPLFGFSFAQIFFGAAIIAYIVPSGVLVLSIPLSGQVVDLQGLSHLNFFGH
ncbi:hypothetical protein ACQX3E_12105, partial [Corynebacterium diphtheriae]